MRFPTMAAVAVALCAAGSARSPAQPPADLEALMRGMAGSPGVVARFVETKHLALLEAPLESRGVLYFVPPDRLVRHVLAPGTSRMRMDRGRLEIRDEAGRQQIDLAGHPIAREIVESFVVLFAGDLAALERRYQVEFEAEPGEAASGWRLRLVPRAGAVRRLIERVEIRGDAAGMRELTLFEEDGDRSVTRLVEVDASHRFTADEVRMLFGDGAE
jgi:hypothetical protein